jgi:hypothetical protein
LTLLKIILNPSNLDVRPSPIVVLDVYFQERVIPYNTPNEQTVGCPTAAVIKHNLDVGPEVGMTGGLVVAQGTPEEIAQVEEGYAGRFLKNYL